MDYKPSDLFVGVIDVFAILLPGALLTFTLSDVAKSHLFGPVLPAIRSDIQGWVIFIFSSYLLGHFIFLLGSFLDRPLYDRYRRKFLKNGERLYEAANQIKQQQLGNVELALEDVELTNAFKWAKGQIQLYHPHAMSQINRLEADSKFFRSLIIVLFVLAVIFLFQASWLTFFLCLVLLCLSFFRYADQRFKSTELAYIYLLALHHGINADGSKST